MKKIFSLLLTLLIGLGCASPVLAAPDMTVTCPNIGVCTVTPVGPLVNESGWLPGSSVIKNFRITNNSTQNGYSAIEVTNYQELKNLGRVIDIEIRRDSPVGAPVYFGKTLQLFRDDGYFTISPISAGQSIDYFLIATMRTSASNEYQDAMARFDLKMGLELTPIPPQSGGGNGSGSSGGGSTSPASPPVCSATPPSSAPSVTITNVGTNTVTLTWTAVSPVTHYGLFFSRNSDGAQYGAPNVGNVTSYTITNLSGGANYSFQVFGVNDCAPGPRSGNASSGVVPGGFIAGRPLGPGNQVLGVQTEVPEVTPSPSPTPSSTPGEVLGTALEVCAQWRLYIPWILLVLQLIFILVVEYYFRQDRGWTKYFFMAGITLASIAIFYWIRECDCYGKWSWLVWLCRWYWVVSVLLTLLLRLFGYAFIEEIEEEKEPNPKA